MQKERILSYVSQVLKNMPQDWVNLTTHRLDIYKEEKAKEDFLTHFEKLFKKEESSTEVLKELPTAYDYIRLGHPLSCVLEWTLGKLREVDPHQIIAFSSRTAPILAILRKNLFAETKTRLVFYNGIPEYFDADVLKSVYGYEFDVLEGDNNQDLEPYSGVTVGVYEKGLLDEAHASATDFSVYLYEGYGSILTINDTAHSHYIADIQHVRRRETVAMTPTDTHIFLQSLAHGKTLKSNDSISENKEKVLNALQDIAGFEAHALVGSSGLSIQYAVMMGLIDHAQETYPGKPIKFIVPPNCYGGTNDQARRVAACLENVAIVDLPVDEENDMVSSLEQILHEQAENDAVPYIIAEIPTNPRVEVPHLADLEQVLIKKRHTASGDAAVSPLFILDQTFCPNVQFMKKGEVLSEVRSVAYASGSKFPSGGRCTAGYCYTNEMASGLTLDIKKHLMLCDNEATTFQYQVLAEQLPSMNYRIAEAYENTHEFVGFIEEVLPEAKINFVSDELAARGFTPSVFSMDLPTVGDTPQEREAYKRQQNLRLIYMMIENIPQDSKFCVSYGQLKGCYWTIPATSTQGTTKEEDKDYIVRASLSPDLNLKKHKEVFKEFVANL